MTTVAKAGNEDLSPRTRDDLRSWPVHLMRAPATLGFGDWIELAVLLADERSRDHGLHCAVATPLAARRAFYLGRTWGLAIDVEHRPGSGRRPLAFYDVRIGAESAGRFLQRIAAAHRLIGAGARWMTGYAGADAQERAKALWRAQLLVNGLGMTRDGCAVLVRTFTSNRVDALVAAGSVLGLSLERPVMKRKEQRNRLLVQPTHLYKLAV